MPLERERKITAKNCMAAGSSMDALRNIHRAVKDDDEYFHQGW